MISTRLDPPVIEWLGGAAAEAGAPKSDVIAAALELYLTLRSPQSRPPGYELSEETRALLAELEPAEPSKPPE